MDEKMMQEIALKAIELAKGSVDEETKVQSQEVKPQDAFVPDENFADTLVSKLTSVLEDKQRESTNQVYETLFSDRLKKVSSEVQGFSDFLASEDSVGETYLSRVNGAKDYETKNQMLDKLLSSYQSAKSKPEYRQIVNNKTKENLQKAQDSYQEIEEKLDGGQIKSPADYIEAQLDVLEAELDRMPAH